jgi:membrane protein DedA with SNARE-associated domain
MLENAGFSQLISQYGYIAIFGFLAGGMIGMPLPDETIMIFAGYLVRAGSLNYCPTVFAAIIGSLSGITVSFLIGRDIGVPILDRFGHRIGLTKKKMARVEKWFNRFGKFALPIGYFVPGVRHIMAYFVGVSRMPYRDFALYAYTGGIFWVVLFVSLGWVLGDSWYRVSNSIHHYWALIVLILVVLVYATYKLTKYYNIDCFSAVPEPECKPPIKEDK